MPAEYQWLIVNVTLLRRLPDPDSFAYIPWPPVEQEGFAAQLWMDAGNVPDPPPAPPPVLDESDYDNQTRALRAVVRQLGNYLGKTQSQIENDFRAAYLSV